MVDGRRWTQRMSQHPMESLTDAVISNHSIGEVWLGVINSEDILTAVNFLDIGQLRERMRVSKRNVDQSVVGERGHSRDSGRLLASSGTRGGDEDPGVLSSELAARPERAGGVPECLRDRMH